MHIPRMGGMMTVITTDSFLSTGCNRYAYRSKGFSVNILHQL